VEKTSENTKPNRRKSPRRKPRTFIKLKCRKGNLGFGANVAVTLLDISETGARLVVTQELTPGQEVELEGHGLKQRIKKIACVRWQLKLDDGNFGAGVEFDKPLLYADWQNIILPN
jgi:hypothetical protein